MNYYEELGVGPEATAEEIRQAYRSLARLLHPDQQAAEPLRRVAEDRMKRLNSAYDTLADAHRRRQYDTALVRLPAIRAKQVRLRARDAWAFGAGLAAAILCWRLAVPQAGTRTASVAPEPSAPSEALARPRAAAGRVRKLVSPLAERSIESKGSAPLVDQSLAVPQLPPVFSAQPAVVVPPSPVISTPPPSVPASRVNGFAGTWVYVRPRTSAQDKSLYPAEYVEAVILEEGDKLRGRYRARYQVPDRPISSEVAFRFEGEAHSGTANLTWTGAAGAEGELKLTLVSNNTLEAEWIATALGAQLGLTSGVSRLTRRLDP